MRKFVFEMMFSEDRSTNDYVDAAVDDLNVQGIEWGVSKLRVLKFIKRV